MNKIKKILGLSLSIVLISNSFTYVSAQDIGKLKKEITISDSDAIRIYKKIETKFPEIKPTPQGISAVAAGTALAAAPIVLIYNNKIFNVLAETNIVHIQNDLAETFRNYLTAKEIIFVKEARVLESAVKHAEGNFARQLLAQGKTFTSFKANVYPDFVGNVDFFKTIFDLKRAEEYLEMANLTKINKAFPHLSQAQKAQRMARYIDEATKCLEVAKIRDGHNLGFFMIDADFVKNVENVAQLSKRANALASEAAQAQIKAVNAARSASAAKAAGVSKAAKIGRAVGKGLIVISVALVSYSIISSAFSEDESGPSLAKLDETDQQNLLRDPSYVFHIPQAVREKAGIEDYAVSFQYFLQKYDNDPEFAKSADNDFAKIKASQNMIRKALTPEQKKELQLQKAKEILKQSKTQQKTAQAKTENMRAQIASNL
ncbi:hypothetical protein Emin_0825 [Elusimicrobium minutum Pei191]|uniref:DUF5667 domain-containing protein n=1 Tax=Elusimicrobium minutum (strain Pei191) TaxID=445932 RepID=B2KCY4_ELUMP|nr:hypothetical protein [Elusimicrobium minutum]ACC98380.1 hypothetical protein Emin_0825 [Elusimicrobium minutum Pei191]